MCLIGWIARAAIEVIDELLIGVERDGLNAVVDGQSASSGLQPEIPMTDFPLHGEFGICALAIAILLRRFAVGGRFYVGEQAMDDVDGRESFALRLEVRHDAVA